MSFLRSLLAPFSSSSAARMAPKAPKPPPAPTVPTAIKSSQDAKLGDGVEFATFASGCFWGTEHLFSKHYKHLPMFEVRSGYTGGKVENPCELRAARGECVERCNPYVAALGAAHNSYLRILPSLWSSPHSQLPDSLGVTKLTLAYRAVCSGSTGHAESVRVQYQSGSVGYGELVEFFYRTHDPTTKDQQGPDRGSQYRSAIFYNTPEQEVVAKKVTGEVQET